MRNEGGAAERAEQLSATQEKTRRNLTTESPERRSRNRKGRTDRKIGGRKIKTLNCFRILTGIWLAGKSRNREGTPSSCLLLGVPALHHFSAADFSVGFRPKQQREQEQL